MLPRQLVNSKLAARSGKRIMASALTVQSPFRGGGRLSGMKIKRVKKRPDG